VREAGEAGADFVKTFSELPTPVWRAAMDEARALTLPVHGHVPAGTAVLAAARAGQRSADHLMQVYEACSADERRWLAARQELDGRALVELRDRQERAVLESFDAAACASVAAALANAGMTHVPTLVLPHAEAHRESRFREDPRWRQLRADEQRRWERILDAGTADDATLGALRWDVSRRIVAALHAAGVPLVAGTDAPMPMVYPGYSLHDELALLVESGLTPAAALRAATLGPAELLGLDLELGSVAVGKRADLVLLDSDPLTDIGNARRVHAVVLDGRLLQKAELEALLARAAR
jgi:imidazolonepropionase-like amidohydrolase